LSTQRDEVEGWISSDADEQIKKKLFKAWLLEATSLYTGY
jgi:hypothetical protein